MDPEVIVPLIVAFLGGGGLASVIAFRKTSAEAGSVAAATLIGVIEELRNELDRKDDVIRRLGERVAILESYIADAEILPDRGSTDEQT